MQLDLNQIFLIVSIIGISVGIALGILKFRYMREDRQTKIHVERFKEPNSENWRIRVRYINKIIERCIVSFNDNNLLWDGLNHHEFTIFEGSARNLSIPNNIFDWNGKVVIRSGNKIIWKKRFKKIQESSP